MTPIRDERSITQLFGDSISELTKLVQNEVDLARAEIGQKLSLGTAAAKLIAVARSFSRQDSYSFFWRSLPS